MKEIYELKGAGRSIREIARAFPGTRSPVSVVEEHLEYIDLRMAEGLENCRVLDREIRALGYQGSYSTVVQYVRPRRRCRQPEATMRFEMAPGEQAQVDWGSLSYIRREETPVWVFVMTLGWSRACRCAQGGHGRLIQYVTFEYNNAKVITTRRSGRSADAGFRPAGF